MRTFLSAQTNETKPIGFTASLKVIIVMEDLCCNN